MTTRELTRLQDTGIAFGETLGLEVPTQYSTDIHAAVNTLLAVDSLLTPRILGMSDQTVWMCRFLAGLLLLTRSQQLDVPMRRRLEVEAAMGGLVILMALRGLITHNLFERLYLAFGGATMVANSLMTRVE